MKTRTYISVCPSCQGKGTIPNPNNGYVTALEVTCPACNGSRTVMVIETDTDTSLPVDYLQDLRSSLCLNCERVLDCPTLNPKKCKEWSYINEPKE